MAENYYIEGRDLKGLQHSENPLPKGEYDNCTFLQCNFSNSHLSNYTFLECVFEECDFSNVHLGNTAFRQMEFISCKMVGSHFDECNGFLLEMSFEDCQLQLASFFQLPLKNHRFVDCQLNEVDFSEANLSSATIRNCDLNQAIFDNTNLEKADLRLSHGFSIDPEVNRISGAKFSRDSLAGLLTKYQLRIE